MLKLNLGCGFRKKEGFVNADQSSGCEPDVRIDLAKTKWPWENDSVDEVIFEFSLEEMGETKSDLFFLVKELYRVCANQAKIHVKFLHPRHDRFMTNPLCVHRLSPDFFGLLSVEKNLTDIATGQHYTCLGLDLGVNFSVKDVRFLLSENFQDEFEKGEEAQLKLRSRLMFENNICEAVEMDLAVMKIDQR